MQMELLPGNRTHLIREMFPDNRTVTWQYKCYLAIKQLPSMSPLVLNKGSHNILGLSPSQLIVLYCLWLILVISSGETQITIFWLVFVLNIQIVAKKYLLLMKDFLA